MIGCATHDFAEQMCSDQGICGYDSGLNTAACLCNNGFAGADCSQPLSTSFGGRVAGAFFGGVALGAYASSCSGRRVSQQEQVP